MTAYVRMRMTDLKGRCHAQQGCDSGESASPGRSWEESSTVRQSTFPGRICLASHAPPAEKYSEEKETHFTRSRRMMSSTS